VSAPAGSTGPTAVLTAWAEMGSACSRNEPGRRHVVRLSGPRHSLIVAGFLSETGANRLAEAINELLTDSLGERNMTEHA
jgi:hypothetical protein